MIIQNMSRPAIARIHLNNLRYNYQLLSNHAGNARIMAIVKANAYGHGLNLIAPALFGAGCRCFGVTDAKEGAKLRDILGNEDKNRDSEITLLSGIFDREEAALIAKNLLTPVITEPEQVDILQHANFHAPIWIKVDTGMNRLGAQAAKILINQCREADIEVGGIMSHLACADSPEHPMNLQQVNAFNDLRDHNAPNLPASLLNSAGMVTMPKYCMDIVRPGIALYGSEPVPDQPLGLKPVMSLTGAVMQIRDISAGAQVSYGATFHAEKAMRIAVISLGYADGLPRALGNRGHAFFAGRKLAIVGRVCMDYTMLDITDVAIHPGDAVEFWGDNLLANDVARSLDTISYALFTGVGARVQRLAESSG
ncbi:MAG: alanine racemase [Mariprofundus sp.]|nr:alanine racemase [Mariprofundus sp.]